MIIGICIVWGLSAAFWLCFFVAVKRGIFYIPNEEAGAPEGASHFSFQHPDASGSKLSVRVNAQSVSSDAG